MPRLPEAVLRKRVQNEVAQVVRKTDHSVMVKDRTFSEWPAVIDIVLKNAPGPVRRAPAEGAPGQRPAVRRWQRGVRACAGRPARAGPRRGVWRGPIRGRRRPARRAQR